MIADRPPILDSNPPPPRRRPKRREKRRGTKCLNCFTPTTSRYCPECGQENVPVNIGLWEIFREAVEEFVRFDSKLIRTLIPLIFSPGKLTREWSAGRRTAFLSPLKLYLTVTAVFFLVLPQLVLRSEATSGTNPLRISTGDRTSPKSGAVLSPEAKAEMEEADKPWTKEYIEKEAKEVPVLIRGPVMQLMKLRNLGTKEGHDLQKQLIQMSVEHFPTALFAMLPLYSAVLWLLYVRNRRFYVEHLVFALHCHAFFFVTLTAAMLTKTLTTGVPVIFMEVVAAIWIPAYSFAALKLAYQQGWIKTTVKWLMLGCSYSVLLGFAMAASLVMAAGDLPEPPTEAQVAAQKAAKDKERKDLEAQLKSEAQKPKPHGAEAKASIPKTSGSNTR